MDSSDEEFFMSGNVFRHLFKRNSIHPINKTRQENGEFHNLYPELRKCPKRFYEYTRMSIETFDYILNKIKTKLEKQWTNYTKTPITPSEQLIITLRFLATGSSFGTLAFSFRVGKSSVRVIVKETCEALWSILQPIHMQRPTEEMFKTIAESFWNQWNFPNCVGAIDGKHIGISYKKDFSIVLQGVADTNCKLIAIEVGGYGKQSDGGTLSSSQLFQLLKKNELNLPPATNLPGTNVLAPYVFIGDETHPLLGTVLRPYAQRGSTEDEKYFNKQLSRARRCVECAFGIINSKWRVLCKPISTNHNLAETIVKAICVLHNCTIDKGDISALKAEADDFSKTHVKIDNKQWNKVQLKTGRSVRDKFRDCVCRNKT